MTKQYLLEQIKRMENMIDEKVKYNTYRGIKFRCFGLRKEIKGFKKEDLLNYLELLVGYGYETEILDNTFTY